MEYVYFTDYSGTILYLESLGGARNTASFSVLFNISLFTYFQMLASVTGFWMGCIKLSVANIVVSALPWMCKEANFVCQIIK